ncbi:unnamed protein product [Closterium sp. NIES-53]
MRFPLNGPLPTLPLTLFLLPSPTPPSPTPSARDLCGQHLTTIVITLLDLVSYPHSMEVRETAVQSLTALAALPHTQVFPHRAKVLRAMDACLDDSKRAVRHAAVMCKTTWCVAPRGLLLLPQR